MNTPDSITTASPESIRTAILGLLEQILQMKGVFATPDAGRIIPAAIEDMGSAINRSAIPATIRETQIWALAALGLTSTEIARKLEISLKTVENHKTSLKQKLGVCNAAGVTRAAIAYGVITAPSVGKDSVCAVDFSNAAGPQKRGQYKRWRGRGVPPIVITS